VPSFCDIVIMVEGNASMYLGSPRMAEMVVGETVDLEQMGGARMHCTVSGCGDLLAVDDADAIEQARLYLSYLPRTWREDPPAYAPEAPVRPLRTGDVPARESEPFDVREVVERLVDADSFFEIKPLFAPELVVGLARLEGRSVGIVANNSAVKGGVLFVDSADKAARFITLCDAFNVPLVYLPTCRAS
jgi:acetyl-CoA carboxylase carboxyltransferase component